MIQIILGILGIFLVWLLYKFYWKPKQLHKRYGQIISKLGYKVYLLPFKLLGGGFVDLLKDDGKEKGDALYSRKYIYRNYDVVVSNALNKITLDLINPKLVKEFFAPQNIFNFYKEESLIRGTKSVVGEGILFSEGNQWKNKRKTMSRAFTFEFLNSNITKFCQIIDQNFDQMQRQSLKTHNQLNKNKFKCYVLDLTCKILTQIMISCFFGCQVIDQQVKGISFQYFTSKLFNDANEVSLTPLPILFGKMAFKLGLTKELKEINTNLDIFRGVVTKLISDKIKQIRQKGPQPNSKYLIEALLFEQHKAKQSQQNLEFQYSQNDILDEFTTFMVAGTDTTSHFLMMLIYYLYDYPEVHQKLKKEVYSIFKSQKDFTTQNLQKLTYMSQYMNETLRFYGPANGIFYRKSLKDQYIDILPIFKDTMIGIQPISNHYSPNYFKNPQQFRPQRWESQCNEIPTYAFAGFSGGPRACIGKYLALLESKIALSKFILRYDKIELPKEQKDRKMIMKLIYEPEQFLTKLTKAQ